MSATHYTKNNVKPSTRRFAIPGKKMSATHYTKSNAKPSTRITVTRLTKMSRSPTQKTFVLNNLKITVPNIGNVLILVNLSIIVMTKFGLKIKQIVKSLHKQNARMFKSIAQ